MTQSDDFYTLGGNDTDDYRTWQYHETLYFDDDTFATGSSSSSSTSSSSHARQSSSAASWFDIWFTNSTSNDLNPVEDVEPNTVLASLIFNSIVCVILLALYELLRRWIPSVYSQRLMYNYMGLAATNTAAPTSARNSLEIMPRRSTNNNNNNDKDEADENSGQDQSSNGEQQQAQEVVGNGNGSVTGEGGRRRRDEHVAKLLQQESYSFTICNRSISLPVLEWCIPVHATPWSTLRHLAGLDAYFYLRYIRMCLKITAVSSFWAIIILFPTYATGGGDQSGFYHFSMANVLQNDKARVWIPTFFCWAFTMYCWFCIRAEMMHYLELRMEFLGGEEEDWILQRMNEWRNGGGGVVGGGGYGPPKENFDDNNTSTNSVEQDEGDIDKQRSRSRSPLLDVSFKDIHALSLEQKQNNWHPPSSPSNSASQRQMNQHRYSLQIEKVPIALRSNTALYNYFNEIFPNQVHSACLAMNVPDLDALSSRRMRVCRRLEKSLAYYSVTGIRPTHVAGRPRFQCCGIESTPIDGWCILCCCFIDSCNADTHHHSDDEDQNKHRTEVYDSLPDKGETVDSILYYTYDLASCNLRLKKLQEEKFLIAETGNSPRHGGIGDDSVDQLNSDWLGMLKATSARAVEGLRDEFEVSGEEDYFGDGVTGGSGGEYGSIADRNTKPFSSTSRRAVPEKTAPLITGDHLTDSDGRPISDYVNISTSVEAPDDSTTFTAFGRKSRYQSRPLMWLRALLWRLGVDFLAAGLDEVRNRTDVVVDNVQRPSMSSTGFVTFKTLTPVTVTTSAPLTYKRNPMEVSVAPEPRDLVWQNVQIDRDIIASREFVANVLLGFGVLFWSIPLTLIQAWAKVETVALIPGLEWVGQIAVGTWKPFVNDYLPVITLLGLILLLPILFTWIATSYEKRKTISGVQNSIVGRYFYYQVREYECNFVDASMHRFVSNFPCYALSVGKHLHHSDSWCTLDCPGKYHQQSEATTRDLRRDNAQVGWLFYITAPYEDVCWTSLGVAAHWSTKPHDLPEVMLQQKTIDAKRIEGGIPKATDQLWLGIPNTVSCHHHLLHLRLYLTLSASRG
jgi:hypothetical protein